MRIYFMQLWMSIFIRSQGGKGQMELDSLESHRLKRLFDLDFAKFRQCHAILQVKCCNSLLGFLVKGANSLILFGLRVSHKVPFAKYFHTPGRPLLAADDARYKVSVKFQVKSPANSSRWTSPVSAYHRPASSCCGISFSQARTMFCLALVHRCLCHQWARRHRLWDICQ